MEYNDTKNMFIGALVSDITVEPIDKPEVNNKDNKWKFNNQYNQWKYYDAKIQDDPSHYYGCIQLAKIIKNGKELIIANVHNKFIDINKFKDSFENLFKILALYSNIIIIGTLILIIILKKTLCFFQLAHGTYQKIISKKNSAKKILIKCIL